MKAMNLPSGESCAPEISGSPKNSSRSINGGRPFCRAEARAGESATAEATQRAAKTTAENLARREKALDFMETSFDSWWKYDPGWPTLILRNAGAEVSVKLGSRNS